MLAEERSSLLAARCWPKRETEQLLRGVAAALLGTLAANMPKSCAKLAEERCSTAGRVEAGMLAEERDRTGAEDLLLYETSMLSFMICVTICM